MLLKPYYLATYVYISKYQDMLMNVAYIMVSAHCFSIEDIAPRHSKCVQYARQNDLVRDLGFDVFLNTIMKNCWKTLISIWDTRTSMRRNYNEIRGYSISLQNWLTWTTLV